MERLNRIKEGRINMARIIAELADLEGSYINKLGDTNRDRIRQAIAKVPSGYSAQQWEVGGKFSLESARESLSKAEEQIHRADTLQTIPEIAEYAAIIEQAREIAGRIPDKLALVDASRLGIIPGRVEWSA